MLGPLEFSVELDMIVWISRSFFLTQISNYHFHFLFLVLSCKTSNCCLRNLHEYLKFGNINKKEAFLFGLGYCPLCVPIYLFKLLNLSKLPGYMKTYKLTPFIESC